jgi:biopolymer transport protein ExbB/TolQ
MPQPPQKPSPATPPPASRAAPAAPDAVERVRIDARRGDPECLVGLSPGRFTVASAPLWFGLAVLLTAMTMVFLAKAFPASYLYVMMDRCWTNWAVLLFSLWCLGILGAKASKTGVQMRALRAVDLVPRRGDFVLSPGTAAEVLRRMRAAADRPKDFLLFRRIDMALSNLGNIGEVRDVGAVLESQADSDASSIDASYTVVRSLIWTIPILGFIGTVVGLSDAIGSFSEVLNSSSSTDTTGIKEKLLPVVNGLSTAFETTLVALLAAVMIQLLSTWVYKREEALLDGMTDYTNEHILSRLKLTDWH